MTRKDRIEQLAIFLACGADTDLVDRLDLEEAFMNDKSKGVRDAYRRRADRLIKAWGER